jgi:hypothetical protein
MASRVSVGKTSPVPLGQQPATNSLPVVFAEDQPPIPVEEQNLIKSEVALSLLGIPRSEVALGIFADVNTYDVNPTEWAQFPLENTPADEGGITSGVEHIPDEAGARLVAPDVSTTVLTSKRFFRYQPGRVSSSTMGVKMNTTEDPYVMTDTAKASRMKGAPSLKKWGIFDKFDGYYFEIANGGQRNDFRCVRRTQAIIPSEPAGYAGSLSWFTNGGDALFNTRTNFGVAGVDPVIVRDGLVYTAAAIYDPSLVYAPEDVAAIDSSTDPSGALKNYQPTPGYAVRLATYNGSAWSEVMSNRQHQFPFDQSTSIPLSPENTSLERGYIRLDAHCNFYKTISNLNRKASYDIFPSAKEGLESSQWGIAGGSISSYNQTIIDNSWDIVPSTANQEKKVWHLLVNTQGEASDFRITDAQHAASPNLPANVKARTVTNGNVTLKEWFNICVPAPYRMVYEWRPVRAMFSGDKLDGTESIVRQSDINTAASDTIIGGGAGGAINRPGEIILTPEGEPLTSQSAYNIDFTKVTMWKIEFSWYGAVGAIFLCYVPVSNGEARWVRVHHVRASNQHSVASLGNATLPITYLTHGGVDSGLEDTDIGNTLVKYGASYYIDGGDKGTVRLLSKASDFQREVPKGFYDFEANTWTRTAANKLTYSVDDHATVPGNVAVGLMGAYLNEDSTAKVKWITQSGDDITLHFSNSSLPASAASGVRLVIPRASKSLLTMRAKDFIRNRDGQPIRNRLQIYPIKYGAGVTGGQTGELLTLRAVKNPLFIVTNTNTSLGSSVPASGASIVRNPVTITNFYVNTKNSTLPVEVGFATPPVLDSGKYRYGYFLGTTDQSTAATGWNAETSDPSLYTPILGKLYRDGSKYYFEKYDSYPEDIYIVGLFIPERHLVINSSGIFSEQILSAKTTLSTTAASGNGTTATISFATQPSVPFTVGSTIAVSGVVPAGYNGTYVVTASTTSSVSYANTTTGSQTSAGSVRFAPGVLGSSSSTDQTKWDRLQEDGLVTWEDITRLSGVRVGQDLALTPVTATGVEILSYYASQGGYQFDLESYFAYNKEYLSFPLTDEVDIINFFGHYDISDTDIGDAGPATNPFKVNNALTWEEQ